MAKKEPPQEYIEVLEVLNVLYDEVDGCSFYDYIFPDNQKQGEQCSHYEKPNAVYLYTDEKDSEGMESGELKAKKETALSLAEMGLSVEKIAKAVNHNVNEVQKWIDENLCAIK